MSLESIRYKRGELHVIDQLRLPTELIYIPVMDAEAAWEVIRSMKVRGAPLIAIVAALGLAVDVSNKKDNFSSVEETKAFLLDKIEYLRTSRPTAVNLFGATDELKNVVYTTCALNESSVGSVIDAYVTAAEQIWIKDVETNKR